MSKLLILIVLTVALGVPAFAQGKQEPEFRISAHKNEASAYKPLAVLVETRPAYTDSARKEGVEGVVRLRVTFQADGTIGAVTPVTGLAYGLTEQAIAAARQIRFQPALKNGAPVTVVKTVEFNFFVFYDENDKDLAKTAEILEMPPPAYPAGGRFAGKKGSVRLVLALKSNGVIEIDKIESRLPEEFKQNAAAAAAQIKFRPFLKTAKTFHRSRK